MRMKLLAAIASMAIVVVVLAVIGYAFAHNVYEGYGVDVDSKGLVQLGEYGQYVGRGKHVKKHVSPCIVNGTVVRVAGRTILLETTNRSFILAILPGALWYVEPGNEFVDAANVTRFIEVGDEVEIVGICIVPGGEGRRGGVGGFETIVVGGILVDLTTNTRISRIV